MHKNTQNYPSFFLKKYPKSVNELWLLHVFILKKICSLKKQKWGQGHALPVEKHNENTKNYRIHTNKLIVAKIVTHNNVVHSFRKYPVYKGERFNLSFYVSRSLTKRSQGEHIATAPAIGISSPSSPRYFTWQFIIHKMVGHWRSYWQPRTKRTHLHASQHETNVSLEDGTTCNELIKHMTSW